ncbi:protein lifeguard 1-like [Oncorhynchus nerka]|uniref:protein lifeguard 1-like n=1 Tax=Oncorhynchus nerka TaxID=8023 RepID=UPI0031B89DBA
MVGTVASFDNTAVVIAMGATVVISFTIIIIFSAQTRVDFTFCNGILLVLAVDLLMFSFFCCFYHSHVLQIVYGSLGALLSSLIQNSLNVISPFIRPFLFMQPCSQNEYPHLLHPKPFLSPDTFSLLVINCQLVMGRQKYALDPEEYVFAALILSIINIFLYLLILMGSSGK